MENIIISKVCGICAGCNNAITTAKQKFSEGNNVVLFKEIVHNPHVNNSFIEMGINVIDDISQATTQNHIIIRAHGEPPETYKYFESNGISYSDCTCPNVTNIHKNVSHFNGKGYQVILIGKYGKHNGKIHPEVFGTIGWCNNPILVEDLEDTLKIQDSAAEKFYLACQTTFNEAKVDLIIEQIKNICESNNKELIINKSVCAAQKNINKHSVELAENVDIMIVVGGKNSSNSLELFNNVKQYKPSIFIEDINDWFNELNTIGFKLKSNTKVGLTAGASTPKEELSQLKNLILNKQMELKNEN